jgi:ATP-binding cassette subfamily F protein 3
MISHDYYSIINSMDYVLLIENKGVRKISMRKFRKMIYASHFEKDYLLIEEKKKDLEVKIATALKNTDFEQAKVLSLALEELILKL